MVRCSGLVSVFHNRYACNAHLRCSAGSTWGMPCYSAAKSRGDNRITCGAVFAWLGSVQSILHHPNHVRRPTIRPVILQTGKPTPPILGTSARARRSGSLRLCKSSCNAHKKHTCKAQQLALAAVVVSRLHVTPGDLAPFLQRPTEDLRTAASTLPFGKFGKF